MWYSVRNIWRLYRKKFSPRLNHSKATENDVRFQKKDFKDLLQQHKDKIVFSSYLEYEKLQLGYYKYYVKTLRKAKETETKEFRERSLPPLPLSLKYYVEKERIAEDEIEQKYEEPEKSFQLPFANTTRINIQDETMTQEQQSSDVEFDKSNVQKWMTNYEQFDDTKLVSATDEESDDEVVENEWCKHYGTPDATVAVSQVPCGGCGALLHCNDPAIPGYLPSELFKGTEIEELKTMECQRCHFLQEYNIALDVTVQPEEYEKLLKSIRHVKSLVLLMVDLTDFPCSIWPGIVDIIGTNRPIFIVANKVDLLPGDSIGYLKRIRESLLTEIKKTKLGEANIKYIALISAKTGFGVEELISAMFKLWLYKGDVFLVGCTNVGKSSLFNALLQSDYCKVHAVDIVKRATVSRWPGTTLNLLKFPINRPSGWKIRQRSNRLLSEAKLIKVENEIRNEQLSGKKVAAAPSLLGHIGRTFSEHIAMDDNFAGKQHKLTVLDENHELFRKSKWLYDTPGVVHPDQVLSLLSTEELLLTIPKTLIRPQTYYLFEGMSILIGGLARIDLLDTAEPCRLTIFCSETLPVTVVTTANADDLYNTFIGTELFAVPLGGSERLRNWPGLKNKQFKFTGEGPKICCGDVVLSSIGWVSITAKKDSICTIEAWTPQGRGIHKRQPSVLPYSINLKGKRIQGTPAYMVGKVYTGDES
ncbi:nitric oxide-associated protein 1 [Bicyclus anynana]|uniref:Nitric oxide-associated protein 1 n=1 Tax=Bicyclus anynana TaxID=110368 RepID=A0A6J1NHZ2_BICAN|nr:nitric oxide-associated protein 1 [Bicyclus anynana]